MGVDDHARVALLLADKKEYRLLAAVDQIGCQMRKRTSLLVVAFRMSRQ